MSTLIIPTKDGFTSSPLLTTMNLYEHDFLFLVPANLKGELKANQMVPEATHKAMAARMAELVQWVERGHTLVVLGLTPSDYHWQEPRGQAHKMSIENFPPFSNVKLTAKSGMSTRSAPAFASLLDPLVGSIDYQYVLKGPKLIPLIFVRTTVKTSGPPDVIAAAVQLGAGFVIFTPDSRGDAYWKAMMQLPSLLRAPTLEFPPWVDTFLTASEKAAFEGRAARKREHEELQLELSRLDQELDAARQLKQLFVGTGTPFEDAVAAALTELGLRVVKGPHPRADLLATDGKRIAAIEAKGVEGTAREEYIRQVMMWMPEVDASLGTDSDAAERDPVLEAYSQQLAQLNLSDRDKSQDCKGILVLGTFRLTPLDQRTQPDFPDNVQLVMGRQDICALSGLQLFSLVVLARSDDKLKAQFREALFASRGMLPLGLDWKQALSLSSG
jgi:hypothetical protein